MTCFRCLTDCDENFLNRVARLLLRTYYAHIRVLVYRSGSGGDGIVVVIYSRLPKEVGFFGNKLSADRATLCGGSFARRRRSTGKRRRDALG